MIKAKLIRTVCVASLALGSTAVVADIINVPGGGLQVTQGVSSPQRGDSNSDVLRRFGQPLHRNEAVGNPAISSWEYPTFQVYFEGNVVIHSVFRAPN